MKEIIKPNWDMFKAKFSDNPQENFEWLCYLLFCKEYKQDKGIFRYKNQSAIETDPIYVGDEVIGWQAKFYSTTLSANKTELIQTLDKAKRDYGEINKLIFYTNQEWGQGKEENDSKAKQEVNEKAKKLGINIQWNTASFFEAPFVVQENIEIARYFFTLEESIIDRINKQILPRIKELNEQYKNTFRAIGGTFLNRREIDICIKKIEQGKSIIIHGKAGQGKSGCTQGIITHCEVHKIPYIAIKLDDRMPTQSVDRWGEELGLTTSVSNAINMIYENKPGVIILDQLDALRWTQIHSRQALITCMELIERVEEINLCKDKKISIVFVCRTYDYENDPHIRLLFNGQDKKQNDEKEYIRWEEVIVNGLDEEVVRRIVGIRYDNLSQKMKGILSIPSNLYIWEHLDQDSIYDDYSTANQLIQKWWEQIKQNCIVNDLDELEVETAKEAIINKISTLGKLHINIKLLKGIQVTDRSLVYLSSNGFIIRNNNDISFAHQSISDYFLAQEMLNRYFEGEDIIEIIGDKHRQTPQRRYQIQMLLQDIQSIDEEEFIQIGINLMKSEVIRFYIKYVFFEVIGQSTYISHICNSFILKYCEDTEFGKHILDGVIMGHPLFVQVLIDNGILDKWIGIKEKRDIAFRLLQSISPQYRKEDIAFMNRHIFKSKEDDEQIRRCFSFDIYKDTDELFELRMSFYEKYPSLIENYIDFRELFNKCGIRTLRIFEFILKKELKGEHLYYYEEKILNEDNEDNEDLIENVDLFLDTLLIYIPQEKKIGYFSKWCGREQYNQGVERICVEIIKKANKVLIKRNPQAFIERYRSYFDKGYMLYNEIILDGFRSFPTTYSTQVINYMNNNFESLIFDKSSGEKSELKIAADIIKKHACYCEDKIYFILEERIIKYIDPRAKDWCRSRIEFNRNNNEHVYWSFWGDLQVELLGVIPKDRITERAKNILCVLKRRNYNLIETNVYQHSGILSGSVSSPIAGKNLSNKQWKRILTNCNLKSRYKSRWIEDKGKFIENSIEEFSRTLEEAVKKEPQRFIELLVESKINVNDSYLDSLFSGVAYSENLDAVSNKLLERMIVKYRYDYKTHRARYICDIVGKKEQDEWSTQILEMLKDIAINHTDPILDKPNVTTANDEQMRSFNMLETNALNCVRGSAASAIGKLLWNSKGLCEYFKNTIAKLCIDVNPAVRLATLDALFSVYNIDKEWAINNILQMLKNDYRLAGYRGMKQMFFLIHTQHQDEIEEIILKCFNQTDEDLLRMGAYTLIEMYIQRGKFKEIVDDIKSLSEGQVKYMLEMVIIYYKKEEYNKLAKQIIMKYLVLDFDLEFPICRIFYDNLVDIRRDKSFLIELVSFKSSKKIVSAFVHYLENSSQSIMAYKEVIFAISYNIIKNNTNEQDYVYGLDEEISKLIIGLYDEASQEKYNEVNVIADECLHIWDLMFEKGIGAARILTQKMLDR